MSLPSGRFNYNHYYPMKNKSVFDSVRRNFQQGGFFKLRVLFSVLFCCGGVMVLFAMGKASAQPRTPAVQTTRSRRG